MRKNLKYNIIGLAMLLLGVVSCDTATQEVSPIVEPDVNSYPTVTGLTLKTTGTIREGDTIVYTITTSAPINRSITFSPVLNEDATTLVEGDDFDFEGGTVNAWETEGELWIISHKDFIGEPAGIVSFSLEVQSIAEKYLLHPDNVFPTAEVTINPGLWLDISMDWSTDDDIDIVIFQEDATDPFFDIAYSDQGATVAQPEGSYAIERNSIGTFYVSIMHWGADAFDYTFTIGSASDGIETITGTFQSDYLRAYDIDPWTDWGGCYTSYRVLKVVNDGTNYTVTKLDEYTPADYIDVADLIGTWSGNDGSDPFIMYATDSVYVTEENGESLVWGLCSGWMVDFWGETVQEGNPVPMRVYANGDVFIPYNYYWTTLYNGSDYDYYIYGSGTYDAGTGLHIEYEMDQDGFLCAGWLFDTYGLNPYFTADLTLGKQQVESPKVEKPENFVKPYRAPSKPIERIIK